MDGALAVVLAVFHNASVVSISDKAPWRVGVVLGKRQAGMIGRDRAAAWIGAVAPLLGLPGEGRRFGTGCTGRAGCAPATTGELRANVGRKIGQRALFAANDSIIEASRLLEIRGAARIVLNGTSAREEFEGPAARFHQASVGVLSAA
jgi:hypothetical protein